MTYQERVTALKRGAKYNPELTDRELSIMIDAAFAEPEETCLDNEDRSY